LGESNPGFPPSGAGEGAGAGAGAGAGGGAGGGGEMELSVVEQATAEMVVALVLLQPSAGCQQAASP